METIENQDDIILSYDILKKNFITKEGVKFEDSLKEWFYPTAFLKFLEWYIVSWITSDLQFEFELKDDWKIIWWNNINHKGTNIKDYLEARQDISHWKLSSDWWKKIQIEKMEKVKLENVNDYIKKLETENIKNQQWYKNYIQGIIDHWRHSC